VHHHLLGGLVHREELAQFGERLLPGLGLGRVQHVVEHVLDEVVLVLEERDDVVGRLHECLSHDSDLRIAGSGGAMGCAPHRGYPASRQVNRAPGAVSR
jgi:hypothetical protein